jgi:hypothetical protein
MQGSKQRTWCSVAAASLQSHLQLSLLAANMLYQTGLQDSFEVEGAVARLWRHISSCTTSKPASHFPCGVCFVQAVARLC